MPLTKKYFSSVEFLIVTAATLYAVVLISPTLTKAQSRNQQINCSHHQKVLFEATMVYALDYEYRLPHEDTGHDRAPFNAAWTQVLDASPYEMGIQPPEPGYNLKMNSRLEDYKGRKSYTSDSFFYLPRAHSPSISPYLFDGRTDNWFAYPMYGTHRSVEPRHDQQSNFLFLDGSSAPIWISPESNREWIGHDELAWDAEAQLENQTF